MLDFVEQKVAPLHLQIADHFKQKILDGELKPADRLPTTVDLAESFGVTPVTIQKSLQYLVQLDLIERFPRRGTFVKNAVAANTIGLVFGFNPFHDQHPFYARIAASMRKRASALGINVKVYYSLDEKVDERAIFDIREDLSQGKLKGLVALRRSHELSDWLGQQDDLFWIDLPALDLRHAMSTAVTHLRELGYQRIRAVSMLETGSLGPPHQRMLDDEQAGLDDAFGGRAPAGTLLRWGQTEAIGYAECKALFSDPDSRPDALYVNHDVVSRGALFALMELGIRVPGDLGFMTHYNSSCDILSPVPLTRIEFDPAEMLDDCLEAIQAHLKSPMTGRYTFSKKRRGRLVLGESCVPQNA